MNLLINGYRLNKASPPSSRNFGCWWVWVYLSPTLRLPDLLYIRVVLSEMLSLPSRSMTGGDLGVCSLATKNDSPCLVEVPRWFGVQEWHCNPKDTCWTGEFWGAVGCDKINTCYLGTTQTFCETRPCRNVGKWSRWEVSVRILFIMIPRGLVQHHAFGQSMTDVK